MNSFYLLSDEIEVPPEQKIDHGSENIVDLLLADVRSGFASRRSGESSFSVTRVKKVSLDSNENITSADAKSGFVRQGYGRRSMRRRKPDSDDNADSESTCSSLEDAMETDRKRVLQGSHDTLLDILSQSDSRASEPQFERYPSLRKKRKDRTEKRSVIDVYGDRERAPSPAVDSNLNVSTPSRPARSKTPSLERPKSAEFTVDYQSSSIRRVKSMNDKRETEKPIVEQDRSVDANDSSESDNLVERLKRKLQRKPTNLPDTTPTTPIRDHHVSDSSPSDETRQRWRSGIASDLQTIDEKSRLQSPSTKIIGTPARNSREEMERRVSHILDPTELQITLEKVDTTTVGQSHDTNANDPRVSVSVRKQINHRWRSDLGKSEIDKVLKTIEDREKQQKHQHQMTTQDDSCIDIPKSDPKFEETLQVKRKQRKQRSQLDMGDVHAALRQIRTNEEPGSSHSHTTVVTAQSSSTERECSPPPPIPPRSPFKENSESDPSSPAQKSNMSKAAKLAAKRKFIHKRFGDKDRPASTGGNIRCKSDVHKEEVDKALRDMKNGMSRSKSYDESVARKASNQNGTIVNGDVSPSQRKSFRGSVGRLGSDCRRHGVYIASSDSDSEIPPEGASSPKRPSSTKSDSPKSDSRLSIKSTSTSTETLRCDTPFSDNESPVQNRKNSTSKSQDLLDKDDIQKPISKDFNQPLVPPRNNRRAVSLVEGSEIQYAVTNHESKPSDVDQSPASIMKKWRKDRKNRSFYDNVQDHEGPTSPRNKNFNDLNETHMSTSPRTGIIINDIGSRCSYASSSDSARDEGFETMSGTVSQRTSMSSTLESEFTPTLSRKILNNMKSDQNEKTNLIESLRPPSQEIVVARGHKQTEQKIRKQRTESWTEQVAATTTANIDKDSSLDSSMEYSVASPDSGHGTFKEDAWSENMDIEATLRVGSPAPSVESPRSTKGKKSKAPLATAEKSYNLSEKKKSVPSYMRDTTSSTKRVDRNSTTPVDTNKRKSTTPSRISNLNRTKTDSNTSITSAVSETSTKVGNKTPNKRSSTGVGSTPTSRSTTPHPPARSTTPHVPVSRSTTPHPVSRPTTPRVSNLTTKTKGPIATASHPSGFNRTQSLRLPKKTRPSMGDSSETTSPAGSRPSSASSKSSSGRSGFMSATASSKARLDGTTSPPPTPPPRTTSVTSGRTTPTSVRKSPAPSPKSTPAPSTLTRHGSLRLPARSAAKLVYADTPADSDKADGKIKSFRSKIGGNKVKPESPTKLATVTEQDSQEQEAAQEKEKTGSSIKRIVNKTKDKILPKRSTDSAKKDLTDKKKTLKK